MLKKIFNNIKFFNLFILLLLVVSYVLFSLNLTGEIKSKVSDIDFYINHATELNINNMVTSIYTGTRAFDTFLEVMVVISTVICMDYLRKRK